MIVSNYSPEEANSVWLSSITKLKRESYQYSDFSIRNLVTNGIALCTYDFKCNKPSIFSYILCQLIQSGNVPAVPLRMIYPPRTNQSQPEIPVNVLLSRVLTIKNLLKTLKDLRDIILKFTHFSHKWEIGTFEKVSGTQLNNWLCCLEPYLKVAANRFALKNVVWE